MRVIAFLALLLSVAVGARVAPASEPIPPMIVAASADQVTFRIPSAAPARVAIRELEPWQVHEPGGDYPLMWSGAAIPEVSVPRVAPDGRDRLYRQFLLEDAATGEPLASPQFVTDLSSVPARTHELLFPREIKGLTCVVDVPDGVNLGIKHANSGVGIGQLIDWANPAPALVHEVDGIPVPINAGGVAGLDAMIGGWTREGILYTPIPINLLPKERDPRDPLIHPQTDMVNQPMGLGAFNMTSAEGVRAYIAFIEFLVERHTREGAPHGQIAALIIGNELQAHWTWHNMGDAPAEQVIREYTLSLRLADLAARSIHRDFKVYCSMTHHWSMRGYLNDPLKEISGIDLLDGILAQSDAQGPFPWHVAFHPYPENLFEPAFWNDETATLRFDAPRITFRNIEVLEAWLAQPRYLFNGQPRRIMLSEQGFHLKDTPDGEALQAAAYAASYVRVSQLRTLDAYHLHRHANHPDEGGLKLGVVDASVNPDGTWTLGARHKLYDVFRAAGTPAQEEAFAFALPIIGIQSWDELALSDAIDTEMRLPEDEPVVFDLFRLADSAELENLDRLYSETVIRDGGFPAYAIFQHPPASGDGRATFTLDLPAATDGQRLVLLFETVMKTDQSTDGVLYRIEIDGEEVFRHEQQPVAPQSHRIDLTPRAGTTVRLTLVTNCINEGTYDWSLWVAPRVVWEE